MSALVAVPALGPGIADALTLPGVSVHVGNVGVSVGGSDSLAGVSSGGNNLVSVPNVGQAQASPPAPPSTPPLPDVGSTIGGITHTGGQIVGGVTGSPPSSGSGGPSNSSSNPGGSGGSGSSGSSGSGSSGPPRASGGGSSGGSTGGAGSSPTPRARARHAAKPSGGSGNGKRRRTGGTSHPVARKIATRAAVVTQATDKKKDSPPSAVAQVINRIEKVIPAPLWGLIGLLALLAGGFAVRSRLNARRARRLERQREELLGDVGLLQRALLPDVPDDLDGIDVSVAYRPAEGPAAGGDFYDVFELDEGRTAIIVGDVCGHGRQALAVTALMRYTLRAYLGAGFEPRVALQVAGKTIEGDPDGELTTVVLAVYDSRAGTLTYACAGHEPPIVLGPGSHDPVTVYSSPPLGGFMKTGHRQTTVPLPPGAAACFFTDGLVEARLGEKMMGRGRLTELVTELAPGEGAQLLLDRLAAAADRAPDDMAACLVRTHDDAVDARPVRLEELESDASELDGDRVLEFLMACGIPESSAHETLMSARAKASEFGGAVLRVHASGKGGRVEILPSKVAALPVPTLAAEARKRASLQVSA